MQVEGRSGVRRFGLTAALALLCLALQPVAGQAQNVQTGGDETLTIKGFIITSLFLQNQNFAFGNGQPAEFPVGSEFDTDEWFLDGDVRNTRITMAFNGPEIEGHFKLAAVLEADFFGGFNGTGAFSDEQPNPRLRLAYVDVIKGKTTYRIGQAWTPLFGNVPASPTHVAFPLGYGSAAMIGWRFPGVYIYRDMTSGDAKIKKKLTFGLFSGSWSGPGDNLNSGSAGEASTTPQVEIRGDFSGKTEAGATWSAYLVGHYDQKDLSGANATAPNDDLDGTAIEFGAKYAKGAFSLQGNAYQGTAIGQQFGNITQFGDISGWGAWIQGGYKFNPNWSGYLFFGVDDPDDADVLAAGASRVENQMIAASTQYSIGPYVFGLEWLHDTVTMGAAGTDLDGDQISASVWYKF
jgi:hypothetical protein